MAKIISKSSPKNLLKELPSVKKEKAPKPSPCMIELAYPPDSLVQYEQIAGSGNWLTAHIVHVVIGKENKALYRVSGSLMYLEADRIRWANHG